MVSTNIPVVLSTPEAAPQVPLDISYTQPMLSPDELRNRALKAHYGVGGVTGNDYSTYQDAFFTGNENNQRQADSATIAAITQQKQQDKLQNLALAKGSALTVDEVREALANKAPQPDPNSVFEDGYGTQFVKALDDAAANMKGTFMDSAFLEVPNQLQATKDAGATTVAWRNYVTNRAQNLNAEIEAQPWYQKAGYFAYSLLPLVYSGIQEYNMRGNVPTDTGIEGMGTSMSSQAEALWRMPYDQRKAKFDEVMNNLSARDKREALQFATAVLGQSGSEVVQRDLFAPLDFTPFLGGMSKGIATKLLAKGKILNESRNAVATAVEAEKLENPVMPPAAKAANAAGDVTESAVKRVADETVSKMEGTSNPAEEAKAFLPTALRTDWKAVESNPGNLSREQRARLKQDYVTAEQNLIGAYENTARPQRTEIQNASEAQLRAIANTTAAKYPGDVIGDISDPIYNNIANTWHQDLQLLNSDGSLFATREAAENYAKAKGYKDVDVIEGSGAVSSEPTGPAWMLRRKRQIEEGAPGYQNIIKNLKVAARDKEATAAARKEARQNLKDFQETVFKHQAELEKINKKLAPVQITQQGVGYYVRHTVPVDEQSAAVRSIFETNPDNKSVVSRGGKFEQWRNALLGKVRIADDSLSFNENANRKIGTYAQNNFLKLMQDEGKFIRDVRDGRVRFDPVTGEDISDIRSLTTSLVKGANPLNGNKKMAQEFNEVLDYGRKAWNEETQKPGYFFKNPGELENHYWATFNRAPTFIETRAYFAYTRALAYDWVQRNLAEYKYKSRLGVQSHSFTLTGADGKAVVSPKFDAAQIGHLPGGQDAILIVDGSANTPKVFSTSQIPSEIKAEIADQIKSGKLRALRIYAPEKRPLEGFGPVGDERIRYVIAKNVESEPLNYTQIPRQEGGHFDYNYSRWLKQPIIREESVGKTTTHWYEGDNTIMALPDGKTGELIADALSKVRRAVKAGDEAAAEAAAKKHFPEDWEKVKGWFKDQRDADGRITRKALSLDHDFHIVKTNYRTVDSSKTIENRYTNPDTGSTTFRDGTRSGSDAMQFQTRYTQERDAEGLFEAKNIGTVNDPIFKFEPAQMIDPLPSMNRALQNIINTSFMDDMKIYSVENWLREARPYLAAHESELRTSPMYHFETALQNLKKDIPWEVKQNLINNWKKIKDFTGTPNAVDTMLTAANQSLEDAMAGAGIVKKIALYPLWKLSDNQIAKNPIRWMRTMAYHFKMGFFATQQLFVNAATFTLMAPLAPRSFVGGIHAAMLHAWSGVNSDIRILEALDTKAWQLNVKGVYGDATAGVFHDWKPGWWSEARRGLQESGFGHVGGEYVDLNDQLATNAIRTRAKDLAELGTIFFRKSEQFIRLAAYYTAYLEAKHAKPLGEFSLADKASVLKRADDLSVNMSRASNSVWTSGLGSIPLQFFNYTKHAGELFWGKRIGETGTDRALARARLIFFNAMMFGVPTGLSVTGIPVQDTIRKYMIDHFGYKPGDNTPFSIFMEGFPVFAAALITGHGNPKDGNWYNIGARYGLGGMTQIKEALFSDKAWYNLLGGASFNILSNTLEAAHPFFAWAGAVMQGKSPPGVKGEDVVDAAREISMVDRTHRLYLALTTGQWFNKTGSSLGAVSPANAAFMAVTGLDPATAGDVYQKNLIKKEEEDVQKTAFKRAIADWRKGLWAGYRNDDANSTFYRTRAMATLEAAGYPTEKYGSFFAIANKGYESLIDSTDRRFYMKDVPTTKTEMRINQYRGILQNQQERQKQ